MPPTPPRLVDLHCDWLLQYAGEATMFDAALYPEIVASRQKDNGYFSQAAGYLQDVSAAVFACYRRADDWARQADPWAALYELIDRIEAEFAGRVLRDPADVDRWRDDRDGLCWAVLGVEGFDALIRTPADLDRLPALHDRGARFYQPVYAPTSLLAGTSQPGDDRGLTDLGRAFMQALADLPGPRPLFDLAHMNPRALGEALDWFEADPSRVSRVLPIYSHGAIAHPAFDAPRALTLDHLRRLRALGGTVGLTPAPNFYPDAESFYRSLNDAAAIPFRGSPGWDGLTIGTDFLGVAKTLPEFARAEEVVGWVLGRFEAETASRLLSGNAESLIGQSLNP